MKCTHSHFECPVEDFLFQHGWLQSLQIALTPDNTSRTLKTVRSSFRALSARTHTRTPRQGPRRGACRGRRSLTTSAHLTKRHRPSASKTHTHTCISNHAIKVIHAHVTPIINFHTTVLGLGPLRFVHQSTPECWARARQGVVRGARVPLGLSDPQRPLQSLLKSRRASRLLVPTARRRLRLSQ
jgi:hypothetical protein